MKHLIIIGVGGFAREVYWHAKDSLGYQTEWSIKGFLDGNVKLPKEQYDLLDAPVLGDIENYEIQTNDVFICAVGDVSVKQSLTNIIESRGGTFMNLIHKTSLLSPRAKLGIGNIFCPFVIISCDVNIGNHVSFNCFSGAAHDSSIGNYTSVMSHVDIMGNVYVGENTYWGSGARAVPFSKIGNNAVIGAGSLVMKKVKENGKVFGVPAIPI